MKKWIVRSGIFLALLVVVTAVALWLVLRHAGQPGGSVLERWIAPQVSGIAQAYLQPELTFEDLDFQLPLTVILSDVRLRAQDPSRPGQIVDLLAVRRMELRLAEMPRTDRPIVISALILEQPVLTLVPDASGEGRFVGLSDLVKKTPTVAAMPRKDGEPAGLGDVFSVRQIELRDAQVVYDPRAPGVEPVRLDQISTKLEVDSQAEGSGWYTVHSTLARDQVFELQIDGRLSINSLVLEIEALRLDAELRQDQSLPVPPELQQLLREHEVAGTLAVTAHGRVDGSRWRDSSVTTEASLTAAHMSVADYRLSIRSLILQAGMADGALNLEQLRIELDHGSIHSRRGQFRLGESPDAELELEARGLWIQDFLATPEPLQRAKFAGRLDADLKLTTPLTARGSGMVGGGWLKVTEGRLLALPVLNELVAATEAVGRLLRSEEPGPTDTLSAEFQLAGDRLTLTMVAVDSPLIALRGQGDIFLDARLGPELPRGTAGQGRRAPRPGGRTDGGDHRSARPLRSHRNHRATTGDVPARPMVRHASPVPCADRGGGDAHGRRDAHPLLRKRVRADSEPVSDRIPVRNWIREECDRVWDRIPCRDRITTRADVVSDNPSA